MPEIAIADLDVLPAAVRDLILTLYYRAVHADRLHRCLLDPPRTMEHAIWEPRPTPSHPGRGYHMFEHALPRITMWDDSPRMVRYARGQQVIEFREIYFSQKRKHPGEPRIFQCCRTAIYPHSRNPKKSEAEQDAEPSTWPIGEDGSIDYPYYPKTEAEILAELAEIDERRLV